MKKKKATGLSKKSDNLDDLIEINRMVAKAAYDVGGDIGISSDSSLTLLGKGHSSIIEECVKIYKSTGIVKNIIDLMTDFAAGGVEIIDEDEERNNFYKGWSKIVRLENRTEHIAKTYLREGNVPIYATNAHLTKKDIKILKSVGAKEKDLNLDFEDVGNKIIPVKYTIYNPAILSKAGIQGNKIVLMKVNDSLVKLIKGQKTPTKYEKLIIDSMPKDIVEKIRNAQASDSKIQIGDEIDDPNLTILYYKKDDWEDWAEPLIFAALDDIKFKKLLRDADSQAARNIISAITLFSLGDKDLAAQPKEIDALKKVLKTGTNVKNLVWNHRLKISTDYAPVEKILGNAKYEAVNSDILSAFGVSQVLVGGAGGNYANSFLSVKTLIERLETCRTEITYWLNKEIKKIMQAMDWDTEPHIRFSQMNLRDESAEKQILTGLVDRNIISPETMLDYMGEKTPVEIKRMERNKELYDNSGITKLSPISDPSLLNTPNQKENFVPKGQNQDGRPKNSNKPQIKKRDTKPKGIGEILIQKEKALNLYEKIETIVTEKFCKNLNTSYKKALSKEHREQLDCAIFGVYSTVGVNSNVEKIDNITDADVVSLYESGLFGIDERMAVALASMSEKIKDVPSAKTIRDLRASALVITWNNSQEAIPDDVENLEDTNEA